MSLIKHTRLSSRNLSLLTSAIRQIIRYGHYVIAVNLCENLIGNSRI